MKNWVGHLGAIIVVAVWGTTFVSSKVLLGYGLMPADIFFYRFLMAYVCMVAVSHRQLFSRNLRDELTLLGLGIMGGSLYFLTENMALVYSTSANVSILVSTTPLVTALLVSCFYRSERMTQCQTLGSLCAFWGVVLVVLNGQLYLHLNPRGDALALCASFTWACYSLLMRRVMLRYGAAFITRKVFGYGVLTILPWFVFVHPLNTSAQTLLHLPVVGNLLFLGLVASTGGFLVWNRVMKLLGPVRLTNYVYFQSLLTMAVGAVVLHERVTWMALLGCVVLIGGMLVALGRKPQERVSDDLPSVDCKK